jgi:hypothetical protein|tara:strand:+ start:163 stop:912 length:750 start_codon:yes stop_codon:yes gene_type:complete
MIKFFRKIRQRLLTENKFSKYLLYAIGEILLVVIGILIALSINNWNEERKSRADEIKILTNIKKSLLSDLDSQFAIHFKAVRMYINRTDSIMYHIQENLPFNDTLGRNLIVLSSGGSLNWTPQLTAYKRLEVKGIDIIENDSLLEAILDIYNLDYPSIQNSFDNYLRNIHEYGRPIARKKLWSSWSKELGSAILTPVNDHFISEDTELHNILGVLRGNSGEIESRMLRAKAKVTHVMNMIDDELNVLND